MSCACLLSLDKTHIYKISSQRQLIRFDVSQATFFIRYLNYLFSQSNRTLQPEINYLCLKKYLNSNFSQTSLLKIHRNIQNVQLDLVFWDRIYIYQYMISLGSATFFNNQHEVTFDFKVTTDPLH